MAQIPSMAARSRASRRGRVLRRKGAVMAFELLFILPILAAVAAAIVEFGLLWAANQQVKVASQMGCRIATLPGNEAEDVDRAVALALIEPNLIAQRKVIIEGGVNTGDPVAVEVRIPMDVAAPDLLFAFGFGLEGRTLIGRTVMRRE